jgi:hypothetical protein
VRGKGIEVRETICLMGEIGTFMKENIVLLAIVEEYTIEKDFT